VSTSGRRSFGVGYIFLRFEYTLANVSGAAAGARAATTQGKRWKHSLIDPFVVDAVPEAKCYSFSMRQQQLHVHSEQLALLCAVWILRGVDGVGEDLRVMLKHGRLFVDLHQPAGSVT
jgi:hypothetical protein